MKTSSQNQPEIPLAHEISEPSDIDEDIRDS